MNIICAGVTTFAMLCFGWEAYRTNRSYK